MIKLSFLLLHKNKENEEKKVKGCGYPMSSDKNFWHAPKLR